MLLTDVVFLSVWGNGAKTYDVLLIDISRHHVQSSGRINIAQQLLVKFVGCILLLSSHTETHQP